MYHYLQTAVRLLAVALTLACFSGLGYSQSEYYRTINYNLINTQNNSSREVCVERILGQCVRWRTEVNRRTVAFWEPHTSQRALEALTIVAGRMLDPKITQCALDNAKREFHDGAPFNIPSYDDFRNFVWGQMNGLLARGFPQVTVQINKLPEGVAGQAFVGNHVDSRYNGEGYSVHGAFNFEVDDEMMRNSDIIQIAGVMVHEMLHQMTHSHPQGYDDENFVVVFQNCFVNNGTYLRPGFELHGGGFGVFPLRVGD